MAFIIKEAGGLATNGKIDILDIVPENIHQRSPIFLGSKDDVNDVMAYIKNKDDRWKLDLNERNLMRMFKRTSFIFFFYASNCYFAINLFFIKFRSTFNCRIKNGHTI